MVTPLRLRHLVFISLSRETPETETRTEGGESIKGRPTQLHNNEGCCCVHVGFYVIFKGMAQLFLTSPPDVPVFLLHTGKSPVFCAVVGPVMAVVHSGYEAQFYCQ